MRVYMKKLALLLTITLLGQTFLPIHRVTADDISITEQPTTSFEPVTTEQPTTPAPEYVISKLSPTKSKVILLDPGHCKKHMGAHENGLKEEKVVLDITKACKNILDEYGGITVYLTRNNMSCLSSLHLGDCLSSRNNLAKRLSVDFLVSMHINADDRSGKSGALILPAYQSGYRDKIRKKTQALGSYFLEHLHSLGLKNRGFWLRKLSNGRYRNGARADYYSIVRNGVLNNIPSLIVEHGYVSNLSDCELYFKTKDRRRFLGEADANAIVSYYGLKRKVITGTFVKKGKSTYYVTDNNQKVKGWVKKQGKWYYFDKTNGKMKTGFVKIGKHKFYLKPSTGEMAVGWFKVKGASYLAQGNGALVRKKAYSDGIHTYLFSSSGKKYTRGKHKINGKTYYVNARTGTIRK